MHLRDIKIRTGWIPIRNPRARAAFYLGILVFMCISFSSIVAHVAAGAFGEPLHPIGFWVAACFVGLLFVGGFYWIISEWFRIGKDHKKHE